MKIKQMVVILFVFLSVIPLTLVGVTNTRYNNQKLESILENDLKTAVSTQVKAIENFYEERATDSAVIIDINIIAQLLVGVNSGASKSYSEQGYAHDLLRSRIGSSKYVESVTVLDKDFIVVACSEKGVVGKQSTLSQMDPWYFSPQMQFSPVIQTEREGSRNKVIVAVQEIYNGKQLAGYVVQEINLDFFENIRVSASLFNNGTIYLLDGKGEMVAAGDTVEARDQFELSMDERDGFNEAWKNRDKSSKSGLLRYQARGQHYLSCYSNLENMDWTMISSVNMDEILQTRESYQDLTVLLLVILVILLVAINIFFAHNVTRPIDSMIERFSLIEKTKDYSIRMELFGKNEFGIIAEEINSLLSNIECYIEAEKKKQKKLKEKAERDPHTGTYNKKKMEQIFQNSLKKAMETKGKIACMFVDVDDFKRFNTDFGHMGGDKVLKFIAENLSKLAQGKVGRQGGDEFVVCLEGMDAEEIGGLAKRFIQTMNEGIRLEEDGIMVSVHCSLGIALSEGADLTYQELIGQADEAMYKVKHMGKNDYYIQICS